MSGPFCLLLKERRPFDQRVVEKSTGTLVGVEQPLDCHPQRVVAIARPIKPLGALGPFEFEGLFEERAQPAPGIGHVYSPRDGASGATVDSWVKSQARAMRHRRVTVAEPMPSTSAISSRSRPPK